MIVFYLYDVVAALHEEVLERDRVLPEELVGVRGDERHAEQAAEVVSAGPGGDLK